MEKYRKEYFQLQDKLKKIKIDIQEILEKYDNNWDYYTPGKPNKLMEVLHELYEERKGEYRHDWEENVLENYRDDCGVPLEDLEKIMDLFIERKIAKRRIWMLKWLILRNFLYYKK